MTVSPSPSSATTASDAIRIAAIYSGARLALALLGSTLALASPQNLADATETPATARQLITVEATTMWTTYATLRTWRRAGRCWLPAGGPYTARLGKNGLSANRREGDGTTPTGISGSGAPWDEDPRSPTYNSFQHVPCVTKPPFAGLSEGMWQQPRPYPFLAVVEYNMRPPVPGKGSGIFLHAQTGGPTIGCISLRKDHLRAVLRWLRPGDAPVIAIGTTRQLRN